MQRITRRSFLGGAPALALATHSWSGFASDLAHEQLLLIGTQTAEPSTAKASMAIALMRRPVNSHR